MNTQQNPRPTETRTGNIALLFFSLTILAQTAHAQFGPMNSRPRFAIPEAGTMRTVAGLSFSMLPRELVGEMVSTLPMAELDITYALPKGFSLHAGASSVYLINQASVGAGYTTGGEHLTATVGGTMTWWYGVARLQGYNASASGSMFSPSVVLEYRHTECVARLKADVTMSATRKARIGDATISGKNCPLVGASLTASLEHRFSENVTLIFGAKLNYSSPGHQTWMAFPSTDKWMTYPTFSVGYVL